MTRHLRAICALTLFCAVLATPAAAAEPSLDTARTEAERGGYRLITTEQLLAHREAGREMLLVDTRQDWEYRAGHIAGAVSFSMEPTWWSRLTSRRALAKALGHDKDALLVFY